MKMLILSLFLVSSIAFSDSQVGPGERAYSATIISKDVKHHDENKTTVTFLVSVGEYKKARYIKRIFNQADRLGVPVTVQESLSESSNITISFTGTDKQINHMSKVINKTK